MNNTISRLCLLICLLAGSTAAMAQGQLKNIEVTNSAFSKQGDNLNAALDVRLNDLQVSTNGVHIYTPVLVSNADESVRHALAPFMVVGKRRATVLERNARYHNTPDYMTPAPLYTLTRANGTRQSIAYTTETPYQPWMSDAHLEITEWVSGCASCDKGFSTLTFADRILAEPYRPSYTIAMIRPEVEQFKRRADSYTATVGFPVDVREIRSSFGDNAAVLKDVDEKVHTLVTNSDLTVTDVTITGYASPEASQAYNKTLSQSRADAFANYLSKKHGLSRGDMRVVGYGEDWAEARRLVEASSLDRKADVLAIIDAEPNADARDAKIKAIDGGATYSRLLREIWPNIRRTVYTVAYNVRSFDVEEAKRILVTNPKLLSLHEMYLVAGTYETDSEEYRQVFDIAARVFPQDPIALMNASAKDLREGNHTAALRRLEPLKDDPRAWNNLGVAYAMSGDSEQAMTYFRKAAEQGDNDARKNSAELQKALGK